MPPILDTAIGTIFVFLLFSLVVSALNEYILSLADQRAKFLRMGLAEMFDLGAPPVVPAAPAVIPPPPTKWEKILAWLGKYLRPVGKVLTCGLFWRDEIQIGTMGSELLKHGLINAFSRSKGTGTPSYIPAGAFVAALMDLVADKKGAPVTQGAAQVAFIRQFLADLKLAKNSAGAWVPAGYQKALNNFITGYAVLLAPAPTNPISALKTKVDDAQALDQAVPGLLAAGLAGAPAFIAGLTNTTVQQQLTDLVKSASTLPATAVPAPSAAFLASVNTASDASADGLRFSAMMLLGDLLQAIAVHASEDLRAGIEALRKDHPKLCGSLLTLFNTVDGDIERFKEALEGWFNGVMDRVGGWYKRFSQKWIVILGFIVAACFNIDTLHIVRALSHNPTLSSAVAAQAVAFNKGNPERKTWDEIQAEAKAKLQPELDTLTQAKKDAAAFTDKSDDSSAGAQAALKKLKEAQADYDKKEAVVDAELMNSSETQFNKSLDDLRKAGIPYGWDDKQMRKDLGLTDIEAPQQKLGWWATRGYYINRYWDCFYNHFDLFSVMIAGWFLTAIAASIGAPFWFDLLGRFINIRAAGKTPGEKEPASDPIKPPPSTVDTTRGMNPK